MKRAKGFYWIGFRHDAKINWIVAEWNGIKFLCPGSEVHLFENEVDEIDEQRIERQIDNS